ncbi:NF-kappa-B inhibitor zeta-like isoform X2 [Salarias fasciatus]|uniref:NF-kappa-B inhibitor zeta-like isoform X2 n=1 Tax=Salarias fasciatus TaxID=181472 RepID=UPI0011769DF0|nr:NF-kappa-B inhibitor zeta-like isoform X2 [Salarias fasciatus]
MQAGLRRNTVKDLLIMKRQQKRTCSPDEQRGTKQPRFQWNLDAFGSPDGTRDVPPPPLHHLQNADPPCGSPGSSSGSQENMSLFHWQVQQAERRVKLLTAEQLSDQDEDGDTFLHIAVAQGKRSLSYALASRMSQTGSLDLKEHNGQTALQIAAASDQNLIAGDLLRHGARLGTRDQWGRTEFHVCAEKGHLATLQSIYRFLTENRQQADVDMVNFEGLTPLHSAVLSHNAVLREHRTLKEPCQFMSRQLENRRNRHRDCVRTLLLMGANCGAQDLKSGRTVLHMAAEEGNLELLEVLLQASSAWAAVNSKSIKALEPGFWVGFYFFLPSCHWSSSLLL